MNALLYGGRGNEYVGYLSLSPEPFAISRIFIPPSSSSSPLSSLCSPLDLPFFSPSFVLRFSSCVFLYETFKKEREDLLCFQCAGLHLSKGVRVKCVEGWIINAVTSKPHASRTNYNYCNWTSQQAITHCSISLMVWPWGQQGVIRETTLPWQSLRGSGDGWWLPLTTQSTNQSSDIFFFFKCRRLLQETRWRERFKGASTSNWSLVLYPHFRFAKFVKNRRWNKKYQIWIK